MSDFNTLAGKGVFDPKFAEDFENNRQKAVEDHLGITLTKEQIEALENIDLDAIKKLAEAFGDPRPLGG